jgi:hypothetical protein
MWSRRSPERNPHNERWKQGIESFSQILIPATTKMLPPHRAEKSDSVHISLSHLFLYMALCASGHFISEIIPLLPEIGSHCRAAIHTILSSLPTLRFSRD